ncbi:MAG: DNA repair protein RecO [Candidatus Staskawiczbacteria bacterium]|jgi:DNA repair protein RecO
MTLKYRTNGFVFKKDERAESDQVFSVFTKDFGRLELKARAIRKITSKLRHDFDIFYLSEIEFIQGKNQKTLTDAVKIKKFDDVILDSQKLKAANQIADILDDFIKGQEKDEATFDLLNELFDNLTDRTLKIKNYCLAFQYFFWNFVSLQGYKLEVENCAICKSKLNQYSVYNFCPAGQPVASPQASGGNYINPAILRRSPEVTSNLRKIAQESRSDGDFYFSAEDGGIICKNCLNQGLKQKINSDVVKILRLIFEKDWQTISKLKIEPSSQKLLEDISQNAIHAFCPVHC